MKLFVRIGEIVVLAGLAFGAYAFFQAREQRATERVREAIEPVGMAIEETDARIDTLNDLLTEPPDSMGVESVAASLVAARRLQEAWIREHRRMYAVDSARILRTLCWASRNQDRECR